MNEHQQLSTKPIKNQLLDVIRYPVFSISALLIVILITLTTLHPETTNALFKDIQKNIIATAGWFYILAVAIILFIVIYLSISKFGNIKLGPDHSVPAFKTSTWFAMLFSAGMGIGLMFFGVAEPLLHYLYPPQADPQSISAAREAMKLTFFHWGLHAWAIYAIVALILAYFSFRHNLPLTLRSALYPIIGERIYGPIGHAVDIFAILGTIFGVATSLGYSALQVNSGFNFLFDIPVNKTVQILLIIGIMGIATLSVLSGLNKGIRYLSELNLILAIIMLLLIVILGPTVLILKATVQNIGTYLADIVSNTFNLYAYQAKASDWLGGWTLLYWGWWLSWSPFVGMFIARISRGRTIREFVIGVLFIPSGFTLFWMSVFGNSAIAQLGNNNPYLAEIVSTDTSLALFVFLSKFPFSNLLSFVAIIMIIVFFVTSVDSSAMVVNMLASGGNEHTAIWQKLFWTSAIGLIAIVLLNAGGLVALQTATIISALPFSIVLLISIRGLFKALQIDIYKKDSQQFATTSTSNSYHQTDWKRRLRTINYYPKRSHVKRFIELVITPAIMLVNEEFHKQGVNSYIEEDKDENRIFINIEFDHNVNFQYGIRLRYDLQPITGEGENKDTHYQAEVFLNEGGQGYDIMGWNQEQIIHDILDQYEKHLYFLKIAH